jgi:GT2 family glycosyltransferase
MKQEKFLLSIIIVNYKEYEFLRRCLISLKNTYHDTEVIVVDNESNEVALSALKRDFGDVVFFGLKENLNYAEGNNFGIAHSSGKFVVTLNNDTIVDKNWLEPLLKVGLANPEALYQPKILFLENPEMVNSLGNTVHLFGFAFPIAIGKRAVNATEHTGNVVKVFYCSGACIFTSRKVFDKLGGFDSNYWTYYEDVNLGWKGNLYGYPSYVVSDSVIYHRWGVAHGRELTRQKLFLLERGRLSSLFRNLSARSIFMLIPFIISLDFVMIVYLIPRKGMAKAKFKATLSLLKNWKTIRLERKMIQKSRTAKDREISQLFATIIEHPYLELSPRYKGLLESISRNLRNRL